MKRSFIALSLLGLVSAAAAQDWFQGKLDQAMAKARSENKLVLIHFDASG